MEKKNISRTYSEKYVFSPLNSNIYFWYFKIYQFKFLLSLVILYYSSLQNNSSQHYISSHKVKCEQKPNFALGFSSKAHFICLVQQNYTQYYIHEVACGNKYSWELWKFLILTRFYEFIDSIAFWTGRQNIDLAGHCPVKQITVNAII